jgi:hypothetical protein
MEFAFEELFDAESLHDVIHKAAVSNPIEVNLRHCIIS